MTTKIVLIGAGGFGKEVASIIDYINFYGAEYERAYGKRYELLGFLDDSPSFKSGDMIGKYHWLGPVNWILDHKDNVVCNCTIGNAAVKRRIQEELTAQSVRFETIVAYGSFVGSGTKIGSGCVMYGGVSVSVDCEIGDGVLLNQGVNIGHDVTIGDYTTIMPYTGISGACKVGSCVSIGGHAFVVPGKKIGDGATVAAGSIVFSNVKAGTTVLGNPAKRMKAIED